MTLFERVGKVLRCAGCKPAIRQTGGLRYGGLRTALAPRRSQRGVALVLTLIMLAIITVVTVTFLLTARRSRSSTTLRIDQTTAEFAAETAFQRANAEIMSRILRDTNLLSFEFAVSQRGPVPVVTNRAGTIERFLDLNRNGDFDNPSIPDNAPFGDPLWIGVLDRPWLPEAPNNRFVARVAYAIVPAGKALDLNTIHNAASPANGYEYVRNQGFGPWELNLGAFLAELHPGIWWTNMGQGQSEYLYGPFPRPVAGGDAMIDARALVDYRSAWGQQSPYGLGVVFPQAIVAPQFPPRSIDAYSDGDDGNVNGIDVFAPDDDTVNPAKLTMQHWSGAPPTNNFFHPQEFFHGTNAYNPNQVTTDFLTNLLRAINGYTNGPDRIPADPLSFYRLMAQLATDTGSDFHDRIHLNYADRHADDGTGTYYDVTNFVSWDATPALAVSFFTNVAQRIFIAQSNEFNFLTTNEIPIRSMLEIPVWPTNRYLATPAVHRILQMAANIFDATHTNDYPSIFRPVFGTKPGDSTVYIVGYTKDERVSTLQPWLDGNTNGIPMVVGAKKGWPNFNEFTLRSDILVSRKLEVERDRPPAPRSFPIATNQMYVLGISNFFGAEAWNSYQRLSPPNRTLNITVTNFAHMWLSNDLGFQTNWPMTVMGQTGVLANTWVGGEQDQRSFIVPLSTNQIFLSNAVYRFSDNTFANISTNAFEPSGGQFPLPYWIFAISNRMAFWIEDRASGRLVDFVLLQDNHVVDLYKELIGAQPNPYQGIAGVSAAMSELWNTNRSSPGSVNVAEPTRGILQQMGVALGNVNTTVSEWREYSQSGVARENDKAAAIDKFREFCGLTPFTTNRIGSNVQLRMQAPFNPAAKIAALSTWQANDPLVHYHPADLRFGSATNNQFLRPKQAATNIAPSSLGRLNDRYSPWGGRPTSSYDDPNKYNLAAKDPGIMSPDDWEFPTNKLANIGLLGRIHRGTPWQTVYFKSEIANLFLWTNASPDLALGANGQLYSRTHPTNDWRLADMFTTALDARTSQGLMSVNQTNMESWSALFSGVVVLSNTTPNPQMGQPRTYREMFIEPWGQRPFDQSQFAQIWSNIYWFQTNMARPLTSAGDLLQLPLLTVNSPFLDRSGQQPVFGLDDFAYERIPQQILSLLRVGSPRFVIYAYGQALQPAFINPANGFVSNYQVTGEFATRTVVRIEGDPRGRLRTVVESFNILPPE